jgi:PAS domain S-box-containing protein
LGEPSGFAVVTRDISERRQLEQTIRNSEARLRLTLDAAEMGAWAFVVETQRWSADRRCLSLYGLSADVDSSDFDWFGPIHPEDRPRVQKAFEEALINKGRFDEEFRTSASKDRGERWLDVHGKVLVDDAGNAERVLGATRDVTGRHRCEEFRKLLPGLIAHDLRSPLSSIQLTSQLLLERGPLSAAAAESVQRILRSTNHMRFMAEQLLDFTQARYGGGLPLARRPIDLAEICRETLFDAGTDHPDLTLRFEVCGDCRGLWDPTRLREVTSNLIGNAIKHGPPGQSIEVSLHDGGAEVMFQVHNGGPAIPQELLPGLFEPFRWAERIEGTKRERSFGLGLYITREIVVAHGGTVEVASTTEAGTTFIVRLPRGMSSFAAPRPGA